jgi:hypothetical protein
LKFEGEKSPSFFCSIDDFVFLSSHFDTKLETHYYSLSHSEGFLSEESYLFVMVFFGSLGFAPPRFAQFCFTSLAGQKTNIPPTLLR